MAAALCLLLSAACGTTVPMTSQSTLPGSSGLGTSGGTTTGTGSPGGATGNATGSGTGVGTTGTSTGTTSGVAGGASTGVTSAGATGAATGSTSGTPCAIPATGRGWDRKNVYLGLMTAKDAEKVLAQSRINLNPGDTAGDAAAVQDAINRRGGLFCRKVVVIVHDNKSEAIQSDPNSAASENCTYFTQDRPVLGVINTVSVLDLAVLRSCLAQHKTPLFTLSTQPFDDKVQTSTAPYFYNGVSVSWTPLIPLLVQRLSVQHWFDPWNAKTGSPSPTGKAKIGILYGTDDAGSRIGPALAAQFRAAGYQTDTFQWSGDSDGSAAVLHFAGNHVTHVVSIDNFLFLFATAAAGQQYYPRYAVNTYNGIQVLLEANTPNPARVLAGAKGFGWFPALDVDAAQGANVKGPGTAACLKDLAAGGQTFSGKRFAEAVALAVCDGVNLAVLGAKAGGGLDPTSVRRGVVQLGPSFPIGGGTRSGLSQTQFGLPGELRDVSYDSSCSCFKYTSKGYPL
ncbi:MAG: hypothetical protein JWO88_2012 [Frankiales bacterium]|nr:hypothetical protein [Frankiales bacterium]